VGRDTGRGRSRAFEGRQDKLAARGGYAHPASPAEAEAFVRSQQELWKPALEQVARQAK
jgi:hypothetical protein